MASQLLMQATSMKAHKRLILMIALLALPASPAVVRGQSVAERCPGYAGELARARGALIRQDRPGAIAALHEAQSLLAECLRRDSGEAGERVLLAASPVTQLRYS